MLASFKEIKGRPIQASDGEIGSVHDIMFEGDCGAVRYFVVDTGGWLFGRKVLVSVDAVAADSSPDAVRVDLTKQAVKDSPELDHEQPFSRQTQIDYHDYYGWPYYWQVGGLRDGPLGQMEPAAKLTTAPVPADSTYPPPVTSSPDEDRPLNTTRRLFGLDFISNENERPDDAQSIGEVEDIVFDTDGWSVRYLVIDRGNEDLTVIPAYWTEYIDWEAKQVRLLVGSSVIAAGPTFNGMDDLVRNNAAELNRYFDTAGPAGLTKEAHRTGVHP